EVVPRRSGRDTKYRAGSVVVVGGQPGMTGAAALTALAALRADAGYVQLAVPNASLPVLETLALEPVKVAWRDEDAVEVIAGAATKASSLALGPGLGRAPERQALVRELLARIDLPAVVDADALFGLEPLERAAPMVLTPHAGELARLLGVGAGWVDAHRLEAAGRAADRFGAVVLLKGRDTIVTAPPGERRADRPRTLVCDLGPPSLATAGTGDVLAGIVAAFLAKGVEPLLAAAAAAIAHALAARAAPHAVGLLASDLLAALPGVLEGAAGTSA
ncbi:MAG: NAD(P)H-hydrate dehydratase, partial [Thermoleophilia bacterium]|nr:NAD(P)H-hydrate dehydratase [Thermoleophilia bacterium]